MIFFFYSNSQKNEGKNNFSHDSLVYLLPALAVWYLLRVNWFSVRVSGSFLIGQKNTRLKNTFAVKVSQA